MTRMPTYVQHEDDQLIYTFDFTEFLESAETISNALITAQAGITASTATITGSSKKVTVKLSGGTIYNNYIVTCQITTNTPQVINRSLLLRIEPT